MMVDGSPLIPDVYAIARRVYALTAKFSAGERDRLGEQLREASVLLATQTTDAVTTDDPAERQEMLRQAGVACIRINLLLRLAGDMGELTPDEVNGTTKHVESVDQGIAHERRSVRR